jgi:hypothetical protein
MSHQPRRHALVVAVQCAEMDDLPMLHDVAHQLTNTLLDVEIGACGAGLPDGQALLYGKITAASVEAQVRAAIDYAAAKGATLVLVILGHGFAAGADLYLMSWNSVEDVRDKAVNVSNLLVEAADRLGVNGVFGVIDTCNAAAAQSQIPQLAIGTREGQARLSLLMASVARQDAYGLGMSQKLTALLRSGLPESGPYLGLHDLHLNVLDVVPEQCLVSSSYDGSQTADPVWLARNKLDASTTLPLGSLAGRHLADALRALYPEREFATSWSVGKILDLRDELAEEIWSFEVSRVQRIIDSLLVAQKTVSFVRSIMADRISTAGLRRALALTDGSFTFQRADIPDLPSVTEADAIETVALIYPASERSCRPRMARFVVLLAAEAGLDPSGPAFREWAESVEAIVPLNDALASLEDERSRDRLRLVVSLHYALAGEWPEELGAWTLCDGKIYQHQDFPCPPDRVGVEEALREAVDWAEEHAQVLGMTLQKIEVAIPADKMLYWYPEQVEYGQRLGVNYDVLTRWSYRFESSSQRVNINARKRLREIFAAPSAGRINWLSISQVADQMRLSDELRAGLYTRAIGLVKNPGDKASLLELLLLFAPIVIWPESGDINAEHRRRVDACWPLLPTEFLAAYRTRWRADGTTELLADLRAVWDDEDWLQFCRSLQRPRTSERSL